MKTTALLLALSILTPLCSQAQIHDFDSLRKSDPEFKIIAKNFRDTFDLFNESKILKVTFESDFKNLVKYKHKDEYQDAIFRVMFNDTVQISRNIQIKPRGNMRKNTCFIPPLKLNFSKKEAFIKQLEYFDKLKMVLDCKRGELYEQYLLQEYYAYKIQNIITDFSLRVRLLEVNYIDLGGRYKDITRFAFIIESIDQLAARHNAIPIEAISIRDVRSDLKTLAEGYLFQYLIGNTDWSIPNLHNIYLLKSKDPMLINPYVIPYDFDYAGIVDANYAIPDKNLGTESVRERVYRGVCITGNELQNARAKIIGKKDDIYALFENDTLLTKANKIRTINYLDEFFTIIENEGAFKRNIADACR